jgi:DNA-directed RNA polymerase I, II, and III subunit RPABC5|tara:strand:- start:2815 stop:3015 length:201 start_codon:yes stop_codon:yes gene_type:complete
MVLADKYLYYCKEVRKIKLQNEMPLEADIYLDENDIKKTPEGEVLDKLHLSKMCCRRHMLTHVDIE